MKEELDRAKITPRALVLEPIARNTAPAIAVAALAALRDNPSAVLAVMPSDHVVKDEAEVRRGSAPGCEGRADGRLVLFGIKPTEPHTGYGYIRKAPTSKGFNGGAFAVDAFYEKPNKSTAESYVADGKYFWNSGIFVLNARTFLETGHGSSRRILDAARRRWLAGPRSTATSRG